MALDKNGIAQRIAKEVKDGFYVNLGIGIPTLVANFVRDDIEVEFQGEHTIEKFGLEFKTNSFYLTTKLTDCLAQDACGIPQTKEKKQLSTLQNQSCAPNSGSC